MENSVLWHYKSLNSEDYQKALRIIKWEKYSLTN
jgi:hypothetical protein